MKTFILAIFGLLALANAEEEFSIDQSEARKANPEPTKAHSNIKIEKPEKRLAKRDAAAYADPDVISGNTRYAPISNPLAPGPVLRAYADPNVQTRYARDLVEEEGDARKANPELTKAYANPGYEQPAYKRLAKRAAFKLADDVITKKFAEAQIDQSEARKANLEPHMAYAHPGYEQPAYKRLAKRAAHKLAEDLIAKKFAEARQDMRWPL